MRNLILTLLLGVVGSLLFALDPSPQLQAKNGEWLLNGQPVTISLKAQPGSLPVVIPPRPEQVAPLNGEH